MNRVDWLAEKRRGVEESFDTKFAVTYDEDEPAIDPTHRRFVMTLLEQCPPDGVVLDAACGTGKYFAMVLDAGRHVVGIDQSAGMLARASTKFPSVDLHRTGLQEAGFQSEFDAVMCIGAMENVPPEDWPAVLVALHRAVRPGGPVYLTVEMTDDEFITAALEDASARGLPAVRGEDLRRGGGYHYYPALDQVRTWLEKADLELVEEAHSPGEHFSYSYEHFLTRARAKDR
jgi:ubiquinone/menaquinone biosynthesis C-methylase UbiE